MNHRFIPMVFAFAAVIKSCSSNRRVPLRLRPGMFRASLIAAALLPVLALLSPVTFANSGGVSATPSVAPANTSVSIGLSASVTLPTPSGYVNIPSFVAVETPSGYIYGCISDSSACDLEGFTASSPGTYQCSIPFGGAASTLSGTTTGGVSAPGDCTGSNSGTWTGMSSTLCGGVAPDGANCVGATGFKDLVSGCTAGSSYWIGFGIPNPPPSDGDTSQAGTYHVVVCWNFVTQNPSGGLPVFSSAATTTTFKITATSVPEFPLGFAFLLAITAPLLLLLQKWSTRGVVKATQHD